MAGPSYYVHFRKTSGDPNIVQGQIVANAQAPTADFDASAMAPQDTTNYGVLEVSQADWQAMSANIEGGSFGKHVDNPETTPVLADGDPT